MKKVRTHAHGRKVCVDSSMKSVALAFAALGAMGVAGGTYLYASSYEVQAASGQNRTTGSIKKVAGWKVQDGRFIDGPYKGFLAESPKREDKVKWTEAEWKAKLTPEQFRILRTHGTEAAFCGVFHDHKGKGYYKVVAIDHPVFKSDAKFDSGTGWPSFFQPYDMDAIWLKPDYSFGMTRMEVLDSKSDGHLGHVFTDGPSNKTGLRFCINSEVLEFVETPE